jgi:hypothetical protein
MSTTKRKGQRKAYKAIRAKGRHRAAGQLVTELCGMGFVLSAFRGATVKKVACQHRRLDKQGVCVACKADVVYAKEVRRGEAD